MGEIINLLGNNTNDKNPELEKLNKLFDQCFTKCKEVVLDITNPNNYSYLIKNYNRLNKYFSMVKNDDINRFIKLNFSVTENFEDLPEKVLAILYLYNLYKLYGDKLEVLTLTDISVLISIYMSYDDDYTVEKMDKIIDFVFDRDLMNEIYELNLSIKEVTHLLENAIDMYLDEHMKSIKSYIKEEIAAKKENLKRIDEKRVLNTPYDIYHFLKSQVDSISMYLISTQNEDLEQKGYEYISNLNMVIYKMKNMPSDNLNKCIKCINDIASKKDLNLIEKLDLIFGTLDIYNSLSDKAPRI